MNTIQLEDLRHKDHIHCMSGVRRFCERTGLCYEKLIRGEVTIEEMEATEQYMGIEVARNARIRLNLSIREEVICISKE